MPDWAQVALAGVLGGLLTLERRAFLQAMFSRPLVAATLVGGVMGQLQAGLYVGMVLELFHLGTASLGAAVPEHETLVATGTAAGAAALAFTAPGAPPPALWSLSILLFAGLGRLGRVLDRRLERHASRVAGRALASAEAGNLDQAMRQNLWAMWPSFVVFGGVTVLCAGVGFELGLWVEQLPPRGMRGLAWAFPAIASVAAAIAARGSHSRRSALFAAAAAGAVGLTALGLQLAGRGGP